MRITIRVVRQLFFFFAVDRASSCGSVGDHHLRGLRFVFGGGFVNCRYYIVFVVSEPLSSLMTLNFTTTWNWDFKKRDGKCNDHATNQWYDWLNNKKWSCCNYGTHYSTFFGCSLPNDNVESSNLRFWRLGEPKAINHSFFVFTWKLFAPSMRRNTTSDWHRVTNVG